MSETNEELKMSPDEIEMPSAPGKGMSVISYRMPSEVAAKVIVPIAHSDIMFCGIQVIRADGETNLHSHSGMDGLWFVLSGRMRFYGEGDKLVGEFGKHEGVFVPRNVPYWFESVGDEPLELLQAESIDRRVPNRRTDFQPKKSATLNSKVVRGASRPA